MTYERHLEIAALILVIIGAINWGLVGLLDIDIVALLFQSVPIIAKIIYIIIGLSGLYLIYLKLVRKV